MKKIIVCSLDDQTSDQVMVHGAQFSTYLSDIALWTASDPECSNASIARGFVFSVPDFVSCDELDQIRDCVQNSLYFFVASAGKVTK